MTRYVPYFRPADLCRSREPCSAPALYRGFPTLSIDIFSSDGFESRDASAFSTPIAPSICRLLERACALRSSALFRLYYLSVCSRLALNPPPLPSSPLPFPFDPPPPRPGLPRSHETESILSLCIRSNASFRFWYVSRTAGTGVRPRGRSQQRAE